MTKAEWRLMRALLETVREEFFLSFEELDEKGRATRSAIDDLILISYEFDR